jgi:hypothetical protein
VIEQGIVGWKVIEGERRALIKRVEYQTEGRKDKRKITGYIRERYMKGENTRNRSSGAEERSKTNIDIRSIDR